jgi:hypothetical protein
VNPPTFKQPCSLFPALYRKSRSTLTANKTSEQLQLQEMPFGGNKIPGAPSGMWLQ